MTKNNKSRYNKLKNDEQRKQFLTALIKRLNESIVTHKKEIVNLTNVISEWEKKLNTILEKEERKTNKVVRSKSFSDLPNLNF